MNGFRSSLPTVGALGDWRAAGGGSGRWGGGGGGVITSEFVRSFVPETLAMTSYTLTS